MMFNLTVQPSTQEISKIAMSREVMCGKNLVNEEIRTELGMILSEIVA